MGRAPCCDKANVKRGPWSPEEDRKLKEYIDKLGTGGNWIALPHKAGLKRCGKSCRLRWLNYLRPNIKHGEFSVEEDRIICTLFATIGSRWSIIAAQLPGRTDNDIKNYWNTKLKKKLLGLPLSHRKQQQQQQQQQQHIFFSANPQRPPSSSPSSCTYYSSSSNPLAAVAAGLHDDRSSFQASSSQLIRHPQHGLLVFGSSSSSGDPSILQASSSDGDHFAGGGELFGLDDIGFYGMLSGGGSGDNKQLELAVGGIAGWSPELGFVGGTCHELMMMKEQLGGPAAINGVFEQLQQQQRQEEGMASSRSSFGSSSCFVKGHDMPAMYFY